MPAMTGIGGYLPVPGGDQLAEYEIPLHQLRRGLPRAPVFCLNERMAGYLHTSTGRSDLEPFWPSRQDHDFDRVCCRAKNAPAL